MGYNAAEQKMSKIVENIITQKDEGYEHYGSVQVSVRDTETNEVRTASVNFCPSKDVGEATAEAIQDASNKFQSYFWGIVALYVFKHEGKEKVDGNPDETKCSLKNLLKNYGVHPKWEINFV